MLRLSRRHAGAGGQGPCDSLDAKGTIEWRLIPSVPTLAAYEIIASTVRSTAVFNLVFVTVFGTLGALTVTVPARWLALALRARQQNSPGRKRLYHLSPFFHDLSRRMIPTYMVVRQLGCLTASGPYPALSLQYLLPDPAEKLLRHHPVSLMESPRSTARPRWGLLQDSSCRCQSRPRATWPFLRRHFWNAFSRTSCNQQLDWYNSR